MLTPLIITDVTRMGGRRVCIAGVTEDGISIRPTLPHPGPGIQENWLYTNGHCVIRPFASVTLDLLEHQPNPPHTEDWLMNPQIKIFNRLQELQERATFLANIVDQSVLEIFGAEIHNPTRPYTDTGIGNRSLGTIRPRSVRFVRYQLNERGNWECHITFTDQAGIEYKLPVTDLSFRYYLDFLRDQEHQSTGSIGLQMQQILNHPTTIFRIGLTRGFNPDRNQPQDRCYLQITGVYTFPDYLEGRCFADFPPQQPEEEIPF